MTKVQNIELFLINLDFDNFFATLIQRDFYNGFELMFLLLY